MKNEDCGGCSGDRRTDVMQRPQSKEYIEMYGLYQIVFGCEGI